MSDTRHIAEQSARQQRMSVLDEMGWTSASGAFLKQVAKAAKWNQAKLAEAAGIARSTLLAIFSGAQTPKEDTLQAICRILNITIDDILEKTGNNRVEAPDYGQPMPGDVRIGDEDYSLVKRYTIKASAGYGRFPLSENISGGVAFSRSWLIRRGIASDLAGLVTVTGDSMAPTISDGSTVLVQFTPVIEREGVYVFSRDGEVLIKRLQPLKTSPDGKLEALVILSDNSEYPPSMLHGDDLNQLRIVGIVRSVFTDL